ncbi:MAG: hypothetical protein CMM58_07415 [Rhodospirillaceae bacterium]|nr:hypothetical protein [Rhodospirillaceae bacterium]|tara:strand:- start:257 stop:742 length:486 start_codon:yes stop_codon:yes gene_type:complete
MMSEIVIRSADESDRVSILEMLQGLQNFEHALHAGRRPGNEVDEFQYIRIAESASNFDGAVLVAVEENRVVGLTAGWMIIDEDQLQEMLHREHGHIAVLFVGEEHRGKDIARLLLEAIQQHLISAGATRISISSLARNGPVITACRTFGFEPYEIKLEKFV